ncbi:hypothetical protein DFR70_1142 [Nocardia tenerifensis]|uniref:Uncharacterized protein n=1 Tax=Nocardia tenerifensis TaxID=228006 RepID=A0A318JX99_9NOCA|nr:hypothetical protein DFR70_1142 [Nocardia tenerifensis]
MPHRLAEPQAAEHPGVILAEPRIAEHPGVVVHVHVAADPRRGVRYRTESPSPGLPSTSAW